jgi:hypothetical protein
VKVLCRIPIDDGVRSAQRGAMKKFGVFEGTYGHCDVGDERAPAREMTP